MKRFCVIPCLIILTINLFSQGNLFPIDSITGDIIYSEVIRVDSVDSRELFLKANEWFVHSFVSAKNVIQLIDKEAGKIIGKGHFPVSDNNNHNSLIYFPILGTVDFTVEIQTRDGRYKYTISDIIYKLNGQSEIDLKSLSVFKGGRYQKKEDLQWADVRNNTNNTILALISSLKKSMKITDNSDKW